MKSKDLNISKLSWDSSLLELAGKSKVSQSMLKLFDHGIKTIKDLVWIFPLRIQEAPTIKSFDNLKIGHNFLGHAKLISVGMTPAYGKRGKNKVQLYNATVVVKDMLSEQYLNLKWFNSYPGLKKQIESTQEFFFMGIASDYKGTFQITNPKINPKDVSTPGTLIIEYPTVNTVSGNNIKNIIKKIPEQLWNQNLSSISNRSSSLLKLSPINESFKVMHGKGMFENFEKEKDRIIYEEFYLNQLKIVARKYKSRNLVGPVINSTKEELKEYLSFFPYEMTPDQMTVLTHIQKDLSSGHPMMRMLQGDVGCGKTSIAVLSSLIIINSGGQVAIMCPTEALALQHMETFKGILPDTKSIHLLLGSTTSKQKKLTLLELESGQVDLIIGTHSLFQDSVNFKNLQLAIIDEQHKFGVEQRQRLTSKGDGTHSLIMTATPIPRTLQLAQYGDLDISTIRSMPMGRKGIQTRIVTEATYEKYLSFIKTRVSLGEQIYIVVPAIEESETQDIRNVNTLINTYKKYFPDLKIDALHGQLKSDEKSLILNHFKNRNIDILISTTVIEVGINVLNSTVMSIYNPDRFGLSSIHQLRGRVGRGDKPGFCFLISSKGTSPEAIQRLKVVEKTIDGFEIAEADLHNRGQGDLFGSNQSGKISSYKIANIIEHLPIFEKVAQDIEILKNHNTEDFNNTLLELIDDKNISSTI
jgi:ATP-dependent DNA helicase RecG